MTRPPAPALTSEELAVEARFDAAPYPAEVTEAHLESVRAAMASPAPAQQEPVGDHLHTETACAWGDS